MNNRNKLPAISQRKTGPRGRSYVLNTSKESVIMGRHMRRRADPLELMIGAGRVFACPRDLHLHHPTLFATIASAVTFVREVGGLDDYLHAMLADAPTPWARVAWQFASEGRMRWAFCPVDDAAALRAEVEARAGQECCHFVPTVFTHGAITNERPARR